MSYNPATDFIGLLRLVGSSLRSERMPGLDYVVAALARAGLFTLAVSQTAPTVNQATTVWLQPASPSWTAEGTVYLWNPNVPGYQVATPALWHLFFAPASPVFQSLAAANNNINSGVTLAAVQRNAPVNTAVALPSIAAQYLTGKDVDLVDYSTNVVGHTITVTPTDAGATIMQRATLQLLSTADNLASVKLRPSPDLNAWVIA